MTTDPGDLVLDRTCGSGTTAYVAEQWGRRWITIDTSRVALALARTRLMTGRFPYYLLADSPEGRKKEAELTGVAPPADALPTQGDIRRGFVYRRVPHVTLKSIANNTDIAYTYRSSFATDALEARVPEASVAALLGHTSTATLHRFYNRLSARVGHLKDAAATATRPQPSAADDGPPAAPGAAPPGRPPG
jgi:integrase